MRRKEFIEKLMRLFPSSFSGKNSIEWLQVYEQVLSSNIDYVQLDNTVMSEYTGVSAPKPAWLKERAKYITKIDTQEKGFQNIAFNVSGNYYEFAYDASLISREQAIKNQSDYFRRKGTKFELVED